MYAFSAPGLVVFFAGARSTLAPSAGAAACAVAAAGINDATAINDAVNTRHSARCGLAALVRIVSPVMASRPRLMRESARVN